MQRLESSLDNFLQFRHRRRGLALDRDDENVALSSGCASVHFYFVFEISLAVEKLAIDHGVVLQIAAKF